MIWAAVLAGALGCYLLKLAGLSVPQRALDHPVVQRGAVLLPVALLSALVATQAFVGEEGRLVVDARAAAVAVAVIAVVLRAPFLLVVVLAAATAALLRLVA